MAIEQRELLPEFRKAPLAKAGLDESQKLVQQTIVLELRYSGLSFTRKVDSEEIAPSGVDPDMLTATKALIDKKRLKGITKHGAAFKRWLTDAIAVETGILRGGMYLVPLALSSLIKDRFAEFKAERAALVKEFVKDYEEAKAEARQKLGPKYNEKEYPTGSQVEAAFGVHQRFLQLNVPAALADHDRELYDESQRQLQADLRAARVDIEQGLLASFAGLVDHACDRLGTDEDGKKRVFRDSMVQHWTDFLTTFEHRNLFNHQELARQARRAKELVAGVTADELRSRDELREAIQHGFEKIKLQMDGMITSRDRKFIFNDDVEVN